LRIYSSKNIIQNVNIGPAVHCSRQSQTSFLASRQVDSSLSNYGHVAVGKKANVAAQAARIDDFVVPCAVEIA
jgi:hypothetical protein